MDRRDLEMVGAVWNYDPIFRGLKLVCEKFTDGDARHNVWNYDPIFRGLKLRGRGSLVRRKVDICLEL